jgi:hypothetical protein
LFLISPGDLIYFAGMKGLRSMILVFLVILSVYFVAGEIAEARDRVKAQNSMQEKISIGIVEDVIFLPWGVKLSARIDTGAATTSLDARDLVVKDNIAEFSVTDGKDGVRIRLPVVNWRYVRSAGARQRRPVVEMEICIGPKRILAMVNLNDRSRMRFPVIIGRNVLKHGFAVDCQCTYILKPDCPEAPTK